MKTSKLITEETMDPNENPALLAYRVGLVEQAVIKLDATTKEGIKEHNAKLDHLAASFASKSDVIAINVRVASLESDRKWLVRLVIGAVVFSMLALVGLGFKLNR